MTRSTCLKQWPPELADMQAAIRFRDHLVEHLIWIQQHRSDNRHYQKIAQLYRRQLVSMSNRLARARAGVSCDTSTKVRDIKKAA